MISTSVGYDVISPRSIWVFSGRYHIISNASLVNNCTVKTLYNVIRYNRIFNIRHKIAGNGSVSIKTPSL